LVDSEKTTIPWRFPGQYADEETGLVYNRFRYYDPDTGAYISKDPIGLLGGLNAYGYVGDPLTWGDVLGLAGCTRVYRGTDKGLEVGLYEETGYLMSDAARITYEEALRGGASHSQSLAEALRASRAAHKKQLAHWGTLGKYVEAHGLRGTEIRAVGQRSMISLTTDPTVAPTFGKYVMSGEVPSKLLLPQTIPGATESEMLALHLIQLR